MKILMVSPRFSPKSGGGGFVITNNLCKELVKRGHQVEVWASDYEADWVFWVKLKKENGIEVVPQSTVVTLIGFHVTPFLKVHCKYDLTTFDIIHLQGCRTFQNIVVSHYARKYKIPYIVDAHGFPIQGSWLHKLVLKTFDSLFANRIVRGAEYCIAETGVGKQEYLRAGVKEERIKIIPCPYDLSIFDNLPSKGEFKKKHGLEVKRIIGFLGGLDRIKGLDFLVEAFAKLKEDKDVFLVLAGTDMGFEKELRELIDKLQLDGKVMFTGYISGRDKLEYLVDCDVCVFPSRAEQGLPFAALEAIMCGVPIIVTDGTGAAEDLRKWKLGYIVTKNSTDDLVAEIERILVSINENAYHINRGQEYIRKNLSITEKVKDYEQVYREVSK